MNSPGIRRVAAGALLELIIDRPERKNAFTNAMYLQFTEHLTYAENTDSVAVVLIRGEAGNFSSGNDLKDFLENPPTDLSSPVFPMLLALASFPKPVICMVEGFAVGIGATMLLHADIVYASPQARFQLPFVNLGLVPEAAASLLLPQLIGSKAAHELLMFGEAFDASTALRLGLINQVIDDKDLHSFAQEKATLLASKPRNAMLVTKALLKQANAHAVKKQIQVECEAFVSCLQSVEAKQAMQAFFKK